MLLLEFSKRASDFIDAADVSGNIRNSNANLNYISLIDQAVTKSGITTGAIYPIVGNSEISHSFNLLNTSQYRLIYSGALTHSLQGIVFSGGYADTTLNCTSLSVNSNSFGVCFKNITGATTPGGNGMIGASTTQNFRIVASSTNNTFAASHNSSTPNVTLPQPFMTNGILFSSRLNNSVVSLLNSVYSATSTAGSMPNLNALIGGINLSSGILTCNYTCQFAYLTSNTLPIEVLQVLKHDIYYAQRSLGRA